MVFEGVHTYLRIRDDDAVVGGVDCRRVGEVWVQRHSEPLGGVRPLVLEVLGWYDDDNALDGAVSEQGRGKREREGGLTCAGRCHSHEVAWLGTQKRIEGLLLPFAQRRPRRRGCHLRRSPL